MCVQFPPYHRDYLQSWERCKGWKVKLLGERGNKFGAFLHQWVLSLEKSHKGEGAALTTLIATPYFPLSLCERLRTIPSK